MSNAVYPANLRGLTFTVVKTPEYSTLIQASPNRYELRLPQTVNPIWHWSLVYDYLKDYGIQQSLTYTDLRTLMGFFAACSGAGDDFLFSDPDDHSVGSAMTGNPLAPNPLAELQLATDGQGNWYSPIQRNLGGFYEDITDLDGDITVYANGVLQTEGTHFTVEGPGLALPGKSFAGLCLAWTAEPTAPITAEFDFYFRVRFEMDEQDFEKFLSQLWTIGGHGQRGAGEVRLVTARPASAPAFIPPSVECPAWVPLPEPQPGLLRTFLYPTIAGAPCTEWSGACPGAAYWASASAPGNAPGSGVVGRDRCSALGPSCAASLGGFALPAWLAPSRVKYNYVIDAYSYTQGATVTIGGATLGWVSVFANHGGSGSHDQVFTKLVKSTPDAETFNFAGLVFTAEIPCTQQQPLGCDGNSTSILTFSSVAVAVDYEL